MEKLLCQPIQTVPDLSLLQASNLWEWRSWGDQSYLTCSLLEPWPHGFFTKQFAAQAPRDLIRAFDTNATVHRAQQVHGDTILLADDSNIDFILPKALTEDIAESSAKEVGYPEADAIVTQKIEQSVWVCTADCVPVLIADRQTHRVAAIHAGWRGTAHAIVPKTLDIMLNQGSKLESLIIVMGPAISGTVYQVGLKVAAQVGASILDHDGNEAVETVLQKLYELPVAPIWAEPEPDKVRLDVRQVNLWQLAQKGISPAQVAIAPYCTYQNTDLFFSYRRQRLKNVQWSGIVGTNHSLN